MNARIIRLRDHPNNTDSDAEFVGDFSSVGTPCPLVMAAFSLYRSRSGFVVVKAGGDGLCLSGTSKTKDAAIADGVSHFGAA